MPIITAREIATGLKLDKLGFIGTFLGWLILKVTRLSKVNRQYDKISHLNDLDFLVRALEIHGVKYEIPEEDLRRLPKDGAFITLSNHPLGGLDGILLLKLMLEHRSDYKIIANFLLHNLKPLKPYVMPVNPFEDRKEAKSSHKGIKEAILHLQEGNPLGIFPAGEVSTIKDGKNYIDKAWEPSAMRLVQKAKVPVIPIYFHAKNSRLFYRLAAMSGTLRTAKLPSELFSQENKVIKVRIGNPVSVKDQEEHTDLKDFTNFLRTKTYMLANPFEKKTLRESIPNLKIPKSPKQIAGEGNTQIIESELQFCRDNDKRLLTSKNYEVFLAQKKDIPNILNEIGRLREITFREIGEGTNNSIDLDKFDDYYHHMFLWDNGGKRLVGAYRMGMGAKIYANFGINGFYLQDLFRFEPELHRMMSQSIEMGRAFIIKEYQQRPMPLFLLWKGIVHCTLRFPEHKYLIGGVSISNKFSNFSKSLMIEFMKSHYYDPYVAQYVRPKKEFKVKLKDADKDFVFDESKSDLNKFDKIIDEVEPGSLRIPVLIKKYIKQNAKVVAFNVDPLFNNAVDGLMYIRIADLPESTVKPVMEEFQAELEQKYFKNGDK
ncbi:lysophospholipid acyltransferase family protein [Aquimarina gracilis]|uniref:Lysophospholipid acyltransferase family protein n=1 Tax=Aquimarina gracilis TaxID=874422 RepID=A0ABU5ZZR0_9FLAO|nr:lysophospholipid acyltransferase family protein [Aquimarina gracilis]MEB3347369.1 lysophospholipid acyltransferase family protein [Aquimarina gracilis]